VTDSPAAQEVDSGPKSRRVLPHLRNISSATAIASLAVALFFNALQVRDSAHQERQTRIATQLQLLTQLNGLVTETQTQVDPNSRELRLASSDAGSVSRPTNAKFSIALKDMDYLAYLFNNGYVDIPTARALWAQRMDCFFVRARLVYGTAVVDRRLVNLARFAGPSGSHREAAARVRALCY
jgi:uncharacterized coiled-coil protein SlyX